MTTTVPPGHEVSIHPPSPLPHAVKCRGGFVIANFGVKGIHQVEDAEHVFDEVLKCLDGQGGDEPILLAQEGSMSDMFAPNNPKMKPLRNGGVIWTVMEGGLDPFLGDALGLERLAKQFQRIATQCFQCIYFLNPVPNQGVLVDVLGGLGIYSRKTDMTGNMLIEVCRPEGAVLSALLGATISPGRNASLLPSEQIKQIRLHPVQPPVVPPGKAAPRNGRRRRLMLRVAEASTEEETNTAWHDLFSDLLESQHPLLVPTSPDGGAMPMDWHGIGMAMPVFSDMLSLQLMVQQTHHTGPFAHAEFSAVELAKWLLEMDVPPVLNVYKTPSLPLYLQPGLGSLGSLSKGRIPTESERRK
mmetsp:Transcript_52625/g.111771  ORF Transcript_52625/g.111771 Transcript_52625/m.111771 type:complete len:357 (+) Transcript_52625:90-1160(+)|eukprot:CAMPEP_0172571238 /NCGR_PEP_ID=MMETSP1067-20121228/130609_1 /TAXON_ID=265564 ORGANISM="Thalassiosira punctigera, Strain Tpunct2005C2" /NCGR_SAMPLE_ID=MMETSP1067 /ASSEMBLY_ACC=CAM_ASM_000444 /LENGTH=356 /DNA_ID=CAMNT_0013363523 /DNA_START=1 /DNA_END=1071 /DNA_ORIENTATION=-